MRANRGLFLRGCDQRCLARLMKVFSVAENSSCDETFVFGVERQLYGVVASQPSQETPCCVETALSRGRRESPAKNQVEMLSALLEARLGRRQPGLGIGTLVSSLSQASICP